MGATEKQWAWFRTRADAIIGRMWSTEYESIAEEIVRLADEAKARSAGTALVAVQRAIADLRVLAARTTRRAMSECEALYADRVRLGFATLADEATAVSAHARYCFQAGERAVATKYAADVLRKIEASRGTAKPPIPPELEAVLQSISGAV
jgi:hypothetical protein